MPSDSYKALNFFILYHYRIHNSVRSQFSDILDIPLYKIIDGVGFDYHSIKTDFGNTFGYLDENKINYENVNLIEKAIAILKLSNNKYYQKDVIQDIMIKYLHISNLKIKKQLERYIESLRDKGWKNDKIYYLKDIRYEIVVNIWGFKVDDDFVDYLLLNPAVSSSEPYGVAPVVFPMENREIIGLIKFMAETRKNEKYQILYEKAKELKKS